MALASTTGFAPMLIIGKGVRDLGFYQQAFGAVETRKFTNPDGSIHVSEMKINGALFHFHEEAPDGTSFSPKRFGGVTTILGLLVPDVKNFVQTAVKAGAIETSPVTDYEYGLRQATLLDPFGHYWQIEQFL